MFRWAVSDNVSENIDRHTKSLSCLLDEDGELADGGGGVKTIVEISGERKSDDREKR